MAASGWAGLATCVAGVGEVVLGWWTDVVWDIVSALQSRTSLVWRGCGCCFSTGRWWGRTKWTSVGPCS